jgi:endonuclease YncB( thermonuclease family)
MFIAVAAFSLLVWADHAGWLLVEPNDDMARYHGVSATIVRVIDGDTLDVDLADEVAQRLTTRVRLWGIDCPEVGRAGAPAEPGADEAADLARQHAEGATVMLFLEPQRTRDVYDRLLAHVELAGGRSLNELLLKKGLARAEGRWSHSLMVQYSAIERCARAAGVGIWSAQLADAER